MKTTYETCINNKRNEYTIQFETGNYKYFKIVEKACRKVMNEECRVVQERMIETLFRGKRKENGEWVYGCLYIRDDGRYEISFYDKNFDFERFTYDIVPETAGQYTGITDDNEKKIFKGDILKVTDCKRKKTYITEVCTYFNTLCVNPNGKRYEFTPIGFEYAIWDDESYEVEVIGNIYDNPELLEVEK